jgi:hypothetical protein
MKISILSLIFTLISIAGNHSFAGTYEKNPEASITYVGAMEKGIAFDISWTDYTGNTEVMIKDKNNNVIYRSTFTESDIKRRFYLSKEESDQYVFTVINSKKKIERRYSISSSFVEQVQVNELK